MRGARGVVTERYTSYPRPVLWLVPEGENRLGTVEPFYLSTLPVTNRQLEAFTGPRERPATSPDDDGPAVGVGLDVASGYCAWYARIARKAIRLPSEAEWEHACRGGASGRWFWGEEEAAAASWVWHRGNSGERVPPLGEKRTNGFGLHAMLGGVWEWTAAADGPVLRGGSWRLEVRAMGCGERRRWTSGESLDDVGFRIARSLRG
jgi:formylglycine-generating enzyme required for sulfatase activity